MTLSADDVTAIVYYFTEQDAKELIEPTKALIAHMEELITASI